MKNKNWPTKKLGELEEEGIIKLGRGNVISKIDIERTPGNYPIYSASKQHQGEFGRYGHYMFNEELITWSVDGGGRFFYRPKHKFSVTNVCGWLRILKPEILNYKYLYFALDSIYQKLTFDYIFKAHPSVIREKYEIPLPPLKIQKRIVARIEELFEKIDKAKELREKAKEETEQIFQSALQKIFRKAERKWRFEILKNICQKITDGTHWTPKYVPKGIPFLSVKNVKENGFDLSDVKYISPEEHRELIKRCKPEKGDIIYTKVGTIGVAQVNTLDFEFSLFVSLALLKLKKDLVLPKFVEYMLNSSFVRNQAYFRTQGAANQNLVIRDIEPIEIPLPPLSEQKKILAYLDALREKVEKLKQLQQRQSEELNELKDSILNKAFNGEL